MLRPLEWEALSSEERLALAKAGERSPLAFTAVWFNLSQGDAFRTNWHHFLFDWAVQQVFAGKAQNVVVNIPPGGTKTEFWSIHLPVYCMTRFPRVRILNTSYSKDLVNENSERSRALLRMEEFQTFYPTTIGKDKVDDWTVERDGKRVHQMFSRPSGGQITGVRGGYMTGSKFSGYIMADDWDKIDDLFSQTKRHKSHTRLINVLRSRRGDFKTPFFFIQQRGHVDDSTAFLLSGGMGLKVDLHITIPALIDEAFIRTLPEEIQERCRRDVEGSEQVDGYWSYWPAKENIHDLIALRNANPYTFQSQYQQSPESLDGGIFAEEDFLFYGDVVASGETGPDLPTPPRFEYRIITCDTAQKTNEWNDWTVFAEWGFYEGRLYRLSYERARYNAKDLRTRFERFVKGAHARNGLHAGNLRSVYVEDKSSGTGLIQEMQGHLPIDITPVPREKDKLTRAMDVQRHVQGQKVVLPWGDKDNGEFIGEVCAFSPDDSHKHDDQTDVMIDAVDLVFVRPNTGNKTAMLISKRKRQARQR
jgi:predicted phage terminase large subunit-like protein